MEERLGEKITEMSNQEFKEFCDNIIGEYLKNSQYETSQPSYYVVPAKDFRKMQYCKKMHRPIISRHEMRKMARYGFCKIIKRSK